ncbi:hypothetical protein IP70_24380 [alpha proteobacterium AAP38]|nr:hypothetical protein IP70_24380 [alpha proteobacterium AAP38]
MFLRLHRIIVDYIRIRLECPMPPREVIALRNHLAGLAKDRRWPAKPGGGFDYQTIAVAADIPRLRRFLESGRS